MQWPIAPMKATSGRLPHGPAWMFEPKWDGHRVIARVRDGIVEATSSSGQSRSDRWPWLAEIAEAVGDTDVIIDGEVIAHGDDGKHLFQSVGRSDRDHVFVAFDILAVDGADVTRQPWTERRALLEASIHPTGRVIVTPATDDGDALMIATRANGFEGVIAKRIDSAYQPGRRSPNWIKVKHRLVQEFVIGGFLVGEGSRSSTLGSLLLGVHESDSLRFTGAVGTGFSDAVLRELRADLEHRATDQCPFDPIPKLVRGRTRWAEPDLVAQVAFAEWTDDGHLRHPVFLGRRDDKPARQIVRET